MALVRVNARRGGLPSSSFIDWSNSLTKSLCTVITPQVQFNLAAPISGNRRASVDGMGFVCLAASITGFLARPVTGNTWTIFADCVTPGGDGAFHAIGGLTNADASSRVHLMAETYPAATPGADFAPYATDVASGLPLPKGQFRLAAVISAAQNTAKIYLNGRLASTVSLSSTATITMDRFTLFTKPPYGDPAITGMILNAMYVWSRDLSAFEVATLSADPWRFLAPSGRYIETGTSTVATLAASFQAQASFTAAAAVGKPLATSLTAIATLTAALTKTANVSLAAGFSAQASLVANPSVTRPLSIAFSSASQLSAVLNVDARLAATFNTAATMVSVVTLGKALSASFAQQAQMSAGAGVGKPLSASMLVSSAFTAYLQSLGNTASPYRVFVPLAELRTSVQEVTYTARVPPAHD